MPKSRNRKNHKEKVRARNKRIEETANRVRNVMKKELAAKMAAAEAAKEAETVQNQPVETPPTEVNG